MFQAMVAFGPDRVMWANDRPPLALASDHAAVLEGTATRVYRLGKDRT
jgi:predicted TIM-barrel fold metal-dependent hydrolase